MKKLRPKTNAITNSIKKSAKTCLPESILRNVNLDNNKFHYPFIVKRGKGPYLYDYDGNRYIDFQLAGGKHLAGYSNPVMNKAVKNSISKGNCFLPSIRELIKLSKLTKEFFPFIDKILPFKNWNDLIEGIMDYVCNVSNNYFQIVNPLEYILEEYKFDPKKFDKKKGIYVCDESYTFPSVDLSGWCVKNNWQPDLIILGEAVSGGYPIYFLAGKAEIIDHIGEWQYNNSENLSTMCFYPYMVEAVIENLKIIRKDIYKKDANKVLENFSEIPEKLNLPFSWDREGLLFYIRSKDDFNYNEVYNKLIDLNILFPPNKECAGFISTKHDLNCINQLTNALGKIYA